MDKREAIERRNELPERKEKRDAKLAHLERKHRQRSCFWTFPWGHVWQRENITENHIKKICLYCGKKKRYSDPSMY